MSNDKKQQVAVQVNPHQAAMDAEAAEPTVAEVETFEPMTPAQTLFQSEAAAERYRQQQSVPELDTVKSALVSSPRRPAGPIVVGQQEQQTKMVKVRPRVTINRFRVGHDWYQLKANQPTLVPRHVATLLEQKNVL